MNHSKYHLQIGATVACTTIIPEATNGVGQRERNGATKDFVYF